MSYEAEKVVRILTCPDVRIVCEQNPDAPDIGIRIVEQRWDTDVCQWIDDNQSEMYLARDEVISFAKAICEVFA